MREKSYKHRNNKLQNNYRRSCQTSYHRISLTGPQLIESYSTLHHIANLHKVTPSLSQLRSQHLFNLLKIWLNVNLFIKQYIAADCWLAVESHNESCLIN